ncbi:hypothetical protein LCGC14_1659660, partial [marine sediment metagenome]
MNIIRFMFFIIIIFSSIKSTLWKDFKISNKSEEKSILFIKEEEKGEIIELWSHHFKFGSILQSRKNISDSHRLEDAYTQMMGILTAIHPKPEKVLSLGLGGGCLPRFHLFHYEYSTIVSVEIDPSIVELYYSHFNHNNNDDTRHKIIISCAFDFIMNSSKKNDYDIIWVDVCDFFDTWRLIPESFKKKDFIKNTKKMLKTDGFLIVNLSSREMDYADVYCSQFKSCILIQLYNSVENTHIFLNSES